MELEIVVWVVLLVLAVILIGFFLNRGSWRSIQKNFEFLAENYDLEVTQPEAKGFGLFKASPSVYGKWDEREMSVQTMSAGLKDSRHSETAVHLQTALREDCILLIRSKKGMNRLERSEFKKLIKVNGPTKEFNKRITITTNRPDWISEKITSSMCERILKDLGSTTGTILLVKGRMSYRELGLLSGAGTLARVDRMIEHLRWLTESLEDGEAMMDEAAR
ncbi:hypothetical protein [Puniceicoccus vermicola]|uniref:Uncharacterized protein n=1 Tax=Puniceicoccus vermicola TaxID=388746 RepID=A0A7X1E2L6_9BACT|nr:hypothetical protein [Puniceicoccus vermicola]MBC2600605.1 hypothetical protein [Puniceicoccus vermicola]